MWRDYKYLLAYLLPFAAWKALAWGGIHTWLPVIIGFLVIPIFDQIIPYDKSNVPEEEEAPRSARRYFDVLLYLHVPLLFTLIYFYLQQVTSATMTSLEIAGLTCSMGLMIGTMGINVAHELGHRNTKFEQWLSHLLLLPALYQHFYIEHNRGHHKYVATPQDPATARKGEIIYLFWFRSLSSSWLGAWKLESERLKQSNISAFSWQNQMLRFTAYQFLYLEVVWFFFDIQGLIAAIAIAVIGVLLLESVNYIEHYGLVRKKLASGRYEAVLPAHSWNSDHEVGRIMLFELTRHSDHHYKATRKFQILRHTDESPQLPLGYPGSILMALVPPLWFKVMNSKVVEWNKRRELTTEDAQVSTP